MTPPPPNPEEAGFPAPDADLALNAARMQIDRPIVLVGLMGAGKTAIGRRLAQALDVPFRDADAEIERAAGRSVQEIFEIHGEAEFRRGERAVIARLLEEPPHVLATGGGAFMDPDTRAAIKRTAVSVWLRAEIDVLMRRIARRGGRPLLQTENPRATMAALLAAREPFYAEADYTINSNAGPHHAAVAAILAALAPAFARP